MFVFWCSSIILKIVKWNLIREIKKLKYIYFLKIYLTSKLAISELKEHNHISSSCKTYVGNFFWIWIKNISDWIYKNADHFHNFEIHFENFKCRELQIHVDELQNNQMILKMKTKLMHSKTKILFHIFQSFILQWQIFIKSCAQNHLGYFSQWFFDAFLSISRD